jgi:hypothetical protein
MGIKYESLDAGLKSLVDQAGLIPGSAEKSYIAASTGQSYPYRSAQTKGKGVHKSISAALAAMTSGRNDVAILSPDSHTQTATVDWNKNMCHLIGAYGPARMNHRSRIGMSGNFTPEFKVTGYGNTFANLYMMHGVGAAANLVGLSVEGERNSFIRCHILPANATELDQAAYRLVSIDKAENYFLDCFFGSDTVAWTNGAMIKLGVTGDGGPPRVVFENCIFLMNADNGQVRFLDASLAGLGTCMMIFLNCQFINVGSALAYAINGAGMNNAKMYFDSRCSFSGVSEIVEVAYIALVRVGTVALGPGSVNGGAITKLGNLLATDVQVS